MSLTVPKNQKALVVPAAHTPFEVQDVDVTPPGAGEVLVRAESVGLNPADWAIVERYPLRLTYPSILGCEAAGTVVQLGEGVASLAVGDKVLHSAWYADGYSAFKQYNLAPADLCVKVPSSLTLDQAASIPVGFNTALVGLYCPPENRGGANLTPFWRDGGRGRYAGQPILILGGSASISQPAIQFARFSGFSPIVTTASLKNAALLTSLGATHVLDRNLSGAAFAAALRAILDACAAPLRVVYDGVSGADIQREAYALLAPGGTFLGCVGARGLSAEQHASTEKRAVVPHGNPFWEDRRQLCIEFYGQIPALFESGELKPNNIEVLPGGFNGAVHGLNRMKEGGVSAQKLVVHPQETE